MYGTFKENLYLERLSFFLKEVFFFSFEAFVKHFSIKKKGSDTSFPI